MDPVTGVAVAVVCAPVVAGFVFPSEARRFFFRSRVAAAVRFFSLWIS